VDYREELENILKEAKCEIEKTDNSKDLNDLRVKYLGKSGIVTALMKKLKDLTPEERPNFGKVVNELRDSIETLLEAQKEKISETEKMSAYQKLWVDPTMPGARRPLAMPTYSQKFKKSSRIYSYPWASPLLKGQR